MVWHAVVWHHNILFPLKMTQLNITKQKYLSPKYPHHSNPEHLIFLCERGGKGGKMLYVYKYICFLLVASCTFIMLFLCVHTFSAKLQQQYERVLCVCLAGIRTYNSNWIFMLFYGSCSWLLYVYIFIYIIFIFFAVVHCYRKFIRT